MASRERIVSWSTGPRRGRRSGAFYIAAGMATYAHGVGNVALANATNFIRAVGVQRLNVSASTSHKGRSTAVVHCSIETEEGKLVAEATYTMFLFGPLDQQG